MKGDWFAYRWLILPFFLLTVSCGRQDCGSWKRQTLAENFSCPYAKRCYCVAKCPYTEPEVSFIKDKCGTKGFVAITAGCFFSRQFKHGSDISYSAGGVTRHDKAIVFRGNQMLQLSTRATGEICQALRAGQNVRLTAGEYAIDIPAKGFAYCFSDKEGPTEGWLPESGFSFPFEDTIKSFSECFPGWKKQK